MNNRYPIDREHPIGGELASVLRGLLTRFRLNRLLARYNNTAVMGAFALINCLLSMSILGAVALLSRQPFIFPSLGPSAILFFYTPRAASASPRNAVCGHALGAAAGYLGLYLFGLLRAGPALSAGVSWARVGAAAFSVSLTSGLTVFLRTPHPPAGATTLIVSLGLLRTPLHLAVLMGAVILLALQAIGINRLAGVDYPLWAPRAASESAEEEPAAPWSSASHGN